MADGVGVQGQLGRDQIQGVVTGAVQVLGTVGQHFGVGFLGVQHLPAPARAVQDVVSPLEGVAHPVIAGRPAQHGSPAAVPDAANDLVFGIVVGRVRILAHVHAGEPAHPRLEGAVVGVREALVHEALYALAAVVPVGHGHEFPVIGPLGGDGGLDGLQLLVLEKVTFQSPLIEFQHLVGSPQHVQQRPVGIALDSVVGAVQSAPARCVQQVTALVVVGRVELLDGRGIGVQKLPFQQRPGGRGHGSRDLDSGPGLGLTVPGDPKQTTEKTNLLHGGVLHADFIMVPRLPPRLSHGEVGGNSGEGVTCDRPSMQSARVRDRSNAVTAFHPDC